jgi:hypothetical protein
MSMVKRLARAVPFQKWRKNIIFLEWECQKVQGLTEIVSRNHEGAKAQIYLFCVLVTLWFRLAFIEEDREVAAHVGLVKDGVFSGQ